MPAHQGAIHVTSWILAVPNGLASTKQALKDLDEILLGTYGLLFREGDSAQRVPDETLSLAPEHTFVTNSYAHLLPLVATSGLTSNIGSFPRPWHPAPIVFR
jgi:hypothetical protein